MAKNNQNVGGGDNKEPLITTDYADKYDRMDNNVMGRWRYPVDPDANTSMPKAKVHRDHRSSMEDSD